MLLDFDAEIKAPKAGGQQVRLQESECSVRADQMTRSSEVRSSLTKMTPQSMF